jgi:hypothetical protein
VADQVHYAFGKDIHNDPQDASLEQPGLLGEVNVAHEDGSQDNAEERCDDEDPRTKGGPLLRGQGLVNKYQSGTSGILITDNCEPICGAGLHVLGEGDMV